VQEQLWLPVVLKGVVESEGRRKFPICRPVGDGRHHANTDPDADGDGDRAGDADCHADGDADGTVTPTATITPTVTGTP